MNKYIITTLLIFLVTFQITFGQRTSPSDIEIGKWESEQDKNSIWEFKSDGKMYSTYVGSTQVDIYQYTISSTPPTCPDAILSVEPNIRYLKIVDEADGDIACFYIYALNDKRLTLMDAVTGHIFPSVRVEE